MKKFISKMNHSQDSKGKGGRKNNLFEQLSDNVEVLGRAINSALDQISSPGSTQQQGKSDASKKRASMNSYKNLEIAQHTFEAFFNGETKGEVANAFAEAFEDWNTLLALKKEYEVAKKIIFEDEKEYGLQHSIRNLSEFIGTIDEYEDSEPELIKKLGYRNYIIPIQKSYQIMIGVYKTLESESNAVPPEVSIEIKKQFINECLSDCHYFKNVPKALESIGPARAELSTGSRKMYSFVSQVYREFKNALVSEEALGELKQAQQSLCEQKALFEQQITAAKQRVIQLNTLLNEDWFKQFEPGVEDSALAAVDSKQGLMEYYQKKAENLISEKLQQTD